MLRWFEYKVLFAKLGRQRSPLSSIQRRSGDMSPKCYAGNPMLIRLLPVDRSTPR